MLFPTISANAITVDSEGNVILLESEQGILVKMLQAWGFDSTVSIGGLGNRSEAFLHPVEAHQKNRQTLYILDDVERRVVLLDKQLQITGQIDFLSLNIAPNSTNEIASDLIPVSCDVTVTGEMMILNQADNRVISLNTAGAVNNTFGGLDYGAGSLSEPVELRIDVRNNVYVSDTVEQLIHVFDIFGVYQFDLEPQTTFRWNRFRIYDRLLICFTEDQLHLEDLVSGSTKNLKIPEGFTLRDVALNRDFLYLLFGNSVHLHRRNRN
ncbi:hypothetical protein [Pontibacter sp. G13]|uniref:hypothetical protein n=1 Tax=Pontibacter sp. G13 TaxID=3074898 RepID=UPI00288BCCF0|nr:hypothetical protein [Pontibacter sp. G13]WNJ19425.1 hypothetical protein RJD25_02940 [Pontibacter sp. G13]